MARFAGVARVAGAARCCGNRWLLHAESVQVPHVQTLGCWGHLKFCVNFILYVNFFTSVGGAVTLRPSVLLIVHNHVIMFIL